MNIKCDICKKELTQLGALYFSPPNENGSVKKTHICVDCDSYVKSFIESLIESLIDHSIAKQA